LSAKLSLYSLSLDPFARRAQTASTAPRREDEAHRASLLSVCVLERRSAAGTRVRAMSATGGLRQADEARSAERGTRDPRSPVNRRRLRAATRVPRDESSLSSTTVRDSREEQRLRGPRESADGGGGAPSARSASDPRVNRAQLDLREAQRPVGIEEARGASRLSAVQLSTDDP